MREESVTLYFQEGASDKAYKASLVKDGAGWSVPFEFGRRGGSMQQGSKADGVPYDKAKAAYDKLVAEKVKKGYKPEEPAGPVQDSGEALVEALKK